MPIAILGVVWPDLRMELHQPTGALGWLLTAYGVGRMISSSWGAMAVRWFGMGRSMLGASIALVAAVAVVIASGAWMAILAGLFGIGLVSGLLDALGNRFIALSGSVGHAGMVAGTYGVGATLGPGVSTVFDGWRVPYLIAMGVAVMATMFVALVGADWEPRAAAVPAAAQASDHLAPVLEGSDLNRIPRAGLAVSLLLFFVFVSIEVGSGSWLATYLEDHRGVGGGRAGLAVTMFWGGVTLGRLSLGAVGKRVRVARFLPGLAALVVAGFALVAVAPTAVVVVATGLVGLALSSTMPTLIASTASRVGSKAVGRVMGWQLVAANAGAISVPALIGVLVDRVGPGVTPIVLGMLAGVGSLVLVWDARRSRKGTARSV